MLVILKVGMPKSIENVKGYLMDSIIVPTAVIKQSLKVCEQFFSWVIYIRAIFKPSNDISRFAPAIVLWRTSQLSPQLNFSLSLSLLENIYFFVCLVALCTSITANWLKRKGEVGSCTE